MKYSSKDKTILACSLLFTFISVFILCYYLFPSQGLRYSSEYTFASVGEHSLIELNEQNVLIQNFKSENIHLKGFKYYLIHSEENKTGTFHMTLSDAKGNIILNRDIPLADIPNADWYSDRFDVTLKKGQVYQAEFYADGCSDSEFPYLILMSKDDAVPQNADSYLNDTLQDGSLLISYEFAKLESTYVNVVILSLGILSILTILYVIQLYFKIKLPLPNILSSDKVKLIKKISIIFLFAVQFILIIPNIVYRVGEFNLDPSWRYFMNIANDLGLKYGTDVYFTYGPLGYIIYLMNLDNSFTYWLGVFIWIIIFAIHILLLRWLYKLYLDHKVSFTAIVLSFVSYVAAMYQSECDNYQLYLLILAIIIYFLGNKKSIIVTNLMLCLMFFCKFSTFTSGVAFITIFVVFQFIFNKDKYSALLMLPSLIIAPISYLFYNPSLKGLYEYVTGILRISSGWMKTQQWDDVITNNEYRSLLIIVLLYIMLIVISLIVNYHKSTILISCSASLFFAYKYSVTAHGIAMGIWLVSMLFSEVILSIDFKSIKENIGKKKGYSFFYSASIIGCLGIAAMLSINLHNNFGQIKDSLKNKAATVVSLNKSSLLPELYDNTYIPQTLLDRIGSDTMTPYPWEVGYQAVYPELNMVFSPSIQNCNLFIPWLDEKVADYYYSDQAPEYILLEDETIYFHIKYLDNPLTWEAIKTSYQAVDTQEGFCLLKKQNGTPQKEMELINSEIYSIYDTIICPSNADYVKVNLDYSLYGELKDFFWRSGMTYMTINYDNETSNTGVIIVPNMPSGFSLDYVPENIDDMSVVLNTKDIPKMSSLQFSGLGLDVLEKEVEVEWFKYID